MTLHWWMHWFWVTTLLIMLASGDTQAAPQSEELQHITTDIGVDRQTDRQARAMYFSKPQATTIKPLTNITENQTTIEPVPTVTATNVTDTNPITWSAINVTETNINVTTEPNIKETNVTLTVNTNLTAPNATFASKKRNLTRPDYVKEATQHDTSIEGVSESKIVTEKPLSLETQTFLQTRIPPNIESYRRVVDEGGMDTGAIAGISFAALVLAALAGSTAFVLYRRRYLNKPQTLNDKCSNPDSSGYLDDSTIRDNSEEMYSLDNDSFLNSLEAMTIQNYWTDTVKHTKL